MGSMWGIVWGTKSRIFVKVERETGFEPATLSLEGNEARSDVAYRA